MRTAQDPNFAPPVEEGAVFSFQDEAGEVVSLEFLGLILHNERRYGFFFPVPEDGGADAGEVLILEVTKLDEDEQPQEFELVLDEAIAAEVYEQFKHATSGMYDFS